MIKFTNIKIITTALAIIIALTISAFTKSYDGYGAASYARNHVLDKSEHSYQKCGVTKFQDICQPYWNKDYNAYPDWSNGYFTYTDCTNYMSQAIEHGFIEFDFANDVSPGVEQNEADTWYHKSNGIRTLRDSVSWVRASVFKKRFDDQYFKAKKVSQSNARLGDVIFWRHHGASDFSHVTMVTWKSGGEIYFSGHQIDRLNKLVTNELKSRYGAVEFWRPLGTPSRAQAIKNPGSAVKSSRLSSSDNISENRPGRYSELYKFTLKKRTKVLIEMSSNDIDCFLFLSTIHGPVTYDDDNGGGTDSKIVKTLNPGTYYIETTSFSKGDTGSYKLSTEIETYSDNPSMNNIINLGSSINEYLPSYQNSIHRSGSYAKTYNLVLTRRTKVQIDLDMSWRTDAYLFLSTSSGSELAHDDDDGGLRDSRITRTLSAGTYQIEVTTFGSRKTGNFTLTVIEK